MVALEHIQHTQSTMYSQSIGFSVFSLTFFILLIIFFSFIRAHSFVVFFFAIFLSQHFRWSMMLALRTSILQIFYIVFTSVSFITYTTVLLYTYNNICAPIQFYIVVWKIIRVGTCMANIWWWFFVWWKTGQSFIRYVQSTARPFSQSSRNILNRI